MKSKYTVPELYAIGIIKAWSKQNKSYNCYCVFDFVKDMLNSNIELDDKFENFILKTMDRYYHKEYA